MGYQFLDPKASTIFYSSDLSGAGDTELWNFAGGRSNQYLTACFESLGIEVASTNPLRLRLDGHQTLDIIDAALRHAATGELRPAIGSKNPMLRGLKFSDLLPETLLQEAAQARIYGDAPWEPIEVETEVFDARA